MLLLLYNNYCLDLCIKFNIILILYIYLCIKFVCMYVCKNLSVYSCMHVYTSTFVHTTCIIYILYCDQYFMCNFLYFLSKYWTARFLKNKRNYYKNISYDKVIIAFEIKFANCFAINRVLVYGGCGGHSTRSCTLYV